MDAIVIESRCICSIPYWDLIDAGYDPNTITKDELQEFFFANGGEGTYHDYGSGFEIIKR